MAFSNQRVSYPMRALVGTTPVADQSLTVSTVAVSFTGFTATPTVDGVDLVTFDVQGSDVRVIWTGTAPTSTTGHILPATTAYTWQVDQFNSAKFIRDTSATADAVIWASAMQM